MRDNAGTWRGSKESSIESKGIRGATSYELLLPPTVLLSWRKADRHCEWLWGVTWPWEELGREMRDSIISRLALASKDNLGPLRKKA